MLPSGAVDAAGVTESLFEQLDFVYMPSRDVAADAEYFERVLGARLLFSIDGMGTRVAMLAIAPGPPRLLLADHLAGDAPILVYRVADLPATMKALASRGWNGERSLEIPQGPCSSFRTPGGQRLAVYERTRPNVEEHFIGRRDF